MKGSLTTLLSLKSILGAPKLHITPIQMLSVKEYKRTDKGNLLVILLMLKILLVNTPCPKQIPIPKDLSLGTRKLKLGK